MQVQSSSFKLETTPTETIQNWLATQLAQQLSLDAKTIDVSEPLTRYGLDSIDAVTMVGDLEDWLELELPSTLFWDYPTIEKSAHYLAENFDIAGALNRLESNEDEIPKNAPSKTNSEEKKGGWGNIFGRLKS